MSAAPIETIKIEVIAESDIDEELDASIRLFLREIFPNWDKIFRERRAWHDATPEFTALATAPNGAIVGHVAVVERTITTEWNCRFPAASVQGVSTLPAFREEGLASALLKRALEESKRRGYLYAILFCREALVRFYEKNQWKLPYDSMIMWRDRELPIHMQSDYPMYRELTKTPLPEGQLDVHNPF